MMSALRNDRKENLDTQKKAMEAETVLVKPQAKECQGLPAASRCEERGMEQILPQSLQRELALPTPGVWTCVL